MSGHVREGQRDFGDDLAARGLEALLEAGDAVLAGRVVGVDDGGGLDAHLVVRVLAQRIGRLPHGEGHARVVGAALGDRGGAGIHDDERHLRLLADVVDGEGVRRINHAGQDLHVVARHQLGGQTLGDVGRGAGGIALDQLDLVAAGDGRVLLHVELDAARERLAVSGLGSGKGRNQAHLHGRGAGGARGDQRRRGAGKQCPSESHGSTSRVFASSWGIVGTQTIACAPVLATGRGAPLSRRRARCARTFPGR